MRLRTLLLLLVALLPFAPVAAHAVPTTAAETAANAAAETDKTAYTLAPDKMEKAVKLSRIRTFLHFGNEIWGIVSLLLTLQLGIAARMRNVAVNLSKNRWGQTFIFLLLFLLVSFVFSLPLSIYGQHVQRAYGLSVQGWGSWLGDAFKGIGIGWGISGLFVMLLFWLMKKLPRSWWLAGALAAMAFAGIGFFLTPYVFDPLFNKFEPLAQSNGALVTQLERVVARSNDSIGHAIVIAPERMFLMKASDKVTTLNAYVTGFGASKRVVVWDTSIAKAKPDEILFIFGHEMGHYVLGHIVVGFLVTCVIILLSFFLGFYLFQFLLRRFGPQWRVPGQRDLAALVIMTLVLSIIGFFAEPVENTLTRQTEHAADVFGQEAMHGVIADPQTSAQGAFQLLGENSYSDPYPSPFMEFWTYSHPAIGRRAAFAKHYNPWVPGATPKYFTK